MNGITVVAETEIEQVSKLVSTALMLGGQGKIEPRGIADGAVEVVCRRTESGDYSRFRVLVVPFEDDGWLVLSDRERGILREVLSEEVDRIDATIDTAAPGISRQEAEALGFRRSAVGRLGRRVAA